MKTALIFCLLLTIVTACNNSKPETLEIAKPLIELSETVYFMGPALDSNAVEVDAACDCCASEIAFLKDSSFIYASYCLGEDSYSSGIYSVSNNQVVLAFKGKSVNDITEMDVVEETNDLLQSSTLEVRIDKPYTVSFDISELKSKKVLTLKYEEGTEYGIENQEISLSKWLREKDEIIRKL